MEHLESLDDGIVIDSEYIRLMDCVGQGILFVVCCMYYCQFLILIISKGNMA